MDFVIFGMGLGATLVVLGWFWRTLGPRLRHRPADGALLSGEEMVARISWTRFCRSGGAMWVFGGCLLLFAAFVSLLLHLSDRTGATVVLAAFLVVALGVIAWLWAYLHRFGLMGLVSPHVPKPATMPAPAKAARRPVPRLKQAPVATITATSVLGPPVPADLAPALVHGPPVPADVTAAPMAASAETAAEDDHPATVERGPVTADERGAPPEPIDGSADDTSETGAVPTVIGAEGRNESAEAAAAPVAGTTPIASTPPGAPEQGNAQGTGDEAGVSDGGVVAAERQDAVNATAAKRGGERAFGSDAFRQSVARQEAHLAQAASGRPPADQRSRRPREDRLKRASRSGDHADNAREDAAPSRRFPAPRGAEGVQWVRADGSDRIPGGFPVKGDPATRLYYPETADQYDRAPARYYFATARDAQVAGYRLAPAAKRLTTPPERTPAAQKATSSPHQADHDYR